MLQEDEKVLLNLVKSYSPKEVLSALTYAFYEHRDELSDLGINDRAKQLSEIAELVREIKDVIEDTGL